MTDFTEIARRAYEAGMDIYDKSKEIRKRFPIQLCAKSITLPSVFALLEMGLTQEEINNALKDSLEIAVVYKESLKADL